MSKHSRGPWTLVKHTGEEDESLGPRDDWSVNNAAGVAVCFEGQWNECAYADAHLIAAAPELLEAVCDLLRYVDDDGSVMAITDIVLRATAAIDKAEGRVPAGPNVGGNRLAPTQE